MMPSGPPTPVGGTQAVTPATLLRTNSSLLGGQGGSIPPQPGFPSIVSPRSQYGNMNVLGNMSNASSLLSDRGNAGMGANQHFGGANGLIPAGSSSGLSGPGSIQRGGTGIASESDPLSGSGKGLTFNAAPMLFSSPNARSAVSSGVIAQMMGSGGAHFPNLNRQMSQEVQNPQELDVQNFQHGKQGQDSSNSLQIPSQHMLGMRGLQQLSAQNNIGLGASQQQQLQSLRSLSSDQNGLQSLPSLRGLMPVKQESQVDQSTQQQLQTLRSMVSVKLEPQSLQQPALQHQHQQQQIASLGSITNVKSEPQHSDQSLFLQQQQLLQSRQSTQQMHLQAASLLQQQRFLQQQQQQQQQQHMIKNLAMQRSQLPQQTMQQLQQQNLTMRPTLKTLAYEPGTCARRLTQYMYQQQRRPEDNNIKFWREFVSEYFAPHAKKRLCVSLYGNGRQTTGVFPQDVWHCDICNIKPGRGFETTVEVLPRLCKIKYDSGTLEELLYVDMPREYHTSSGYIVLDYGKAIQESVFEQLRVVRDGRLRVVFSTDLKICSWEFCARRHEELIPRRLIFSQVSQLGTVAQKFQTSTQNGLSNLSSQELQNTCNMFVASARHLAKAMEVPLVNDLGYTKRYVRCLQISEVVNSMKDLIDYSRETKSGPIASLTNFPRRTACSGGTNQIQQQSEEPARSQNGEGPAQACVQQLTQGNGSVGLTNAHTSPTCSTPTTALSGVVPQNMNSRQDNPLNNKTAPHFGNSMQISAASSNPLPQPSQPNPSSPFSNTALAAPNRSPTSIPSTARSTSANSPANTPPQQSTLSGLVDLEESQSSVQQIIQEIMMSTQVNSGVNVFGVGPVRNEMKLMNTASMQSGNTSLKGANSLFVNGSTSGIGINGVAGVGFNMDPPISGATSGARIVSNNSVPTLNGCISVPSFPQQDTNVNHQQDINSRMLSGLGTVNSFNNLQFDWNASP